VRRACRHCLFPIRLETWEWASRVDRWVHVWHNGRHCAWRDTLAEPFEVAP